MPGPVADRAALMRATAANLEPLLLAYRDGDATRRAVVERTIAAARSRCWRPPPRTAVRHRLWALTDPAELAAVDADLAAPAGPDRRRPPPLGDVPAAAGRPRTRHRPGTTAWSCWWTPPATRCGYAPSTAYCRNCRRPRRSHAVRAPSAYGSCRPAPGRRRSTPWRAAAVDGNAFLLAGDRRPSTCWTGPTPRVLDRRGRRPARRSGAAWTPPSCTACCSTTSGSVPDAPEHIRLHPRHRGRRRPGRTAAAAPRCCMHPVDERVVLELARQGVDDAPQVHVLRPQAGERAGDAQPRTRLTRRSRALRAWTRRGRHRRCAGAALGWSLTSPLGAVSPLRRSVAVVPVVPVGLTERRVEERRRKVVVGHVDQLLGCRDSASSCATSSSSSSRPRRRPRLRRLRRGRRRPRRRSRRRRRRPGRRPRPRVGVLGPGVGVGVGVGGLVVEGVHELDTVELGEPVGGVGGAVLVRLQRLGEPVAGLAPRGRPAAARPRRRTAVARSTGAPRWRPARSSAA